MDAERRARACRECGGRVDPRSRRPLCPACARGSCTRCGARLAPGQRHNICADCRAGKNPSPYQGRVCRECGGSVHPTALRDLCSACRRRFCCRCDMPLPAGRRTPECVACVRARQEQAYSRPDRRCYQCGGQPTPRGFVCSACARASYELARRARLALAPRPCGACGVLMPKGRFSDRCAACDLARSRKQSWRHGPCALCQAAPRRGGCYCRACFRALARWRRAYHAGDPDARLLRKIGRRRAWQEKAA